MFRPAAQRFFRSLARNNSKAWFDANRTVYETEVREPLKALVEDLDVRLATIAPEIVGDPKRSLFRINRDIRFSKDKSPYKTNAGCWLYHQDSGRQVGRDSEGGSAGFYFHLDGATSFVAGGIWMPPRDSLGKIRDAIAERPGELAALVAEPAFRRRFGPLDREHRLSRVPRGYPPNHPAADWLRYQSFTAGRTVAPAEIGSPRLADKLARDLALLTPLVRWLNRALGYRTLGGRR
jgi:uncharacterized protein (TIGR02453 family)